METLEKPKKSEKEITNIEDLVPDADTLDPKKTLELSPKEARELRERMERKREEESKKLYEEKAGKPELDEIISKVGDVSPEELDIIRKAQEIEPQKATEDIVRDLREQGLLDKEEEEDGVAA